MSDFSAKQADTLRAVLGLITRERDPMVLGRVAARMLEERGHAARCEVVFGTSRETRGGQEIYPIVDRDHHLGALWAQPVADADRTLLSDVATLFGHALGAVAVARAEASAEREAIPVDPETLGFAASVPGVLCSFGIDACGIPVMPFASPRARDVLGFSSAELAEHLSLAIDRTDEETRATVARALAESAQGMTPFFAELAYQHPEKGARWLEVRALPHRESSRLLFHGVVTDITEQRVREQESRKSDLLLRTMFELASVGVALTDAVSGRFIQVNERFCELVGYGKDDLAALTLADLGDPESSEDQLPRVLGGEVPVLRGERRCLRKDRSAIWLDLSVAPVSLGAELFCVVIIQDIGARRLAERSLRESEQRYRNLIDNLEDVVFSVDESQRILFVSGAVSRFGFAPPELVGRPFLDLVHPDDVVRTFVLFGQRLDGEGSASGEFRILDAGNKIRHVRVTSRLVKGQEGRTEIRGVLVDLTLQRETEAQLRMAQKMEAIGRLAGGVAHDFNNVLTVISTYCQFALDAVGKDEPLHEDLTEIRRATERASTLTHQLLAFGRKQVLQPRPLRISELLDSTAKLFERVIGEDIELVIVHDAASAFASVDPSQLEQVIMNLVINARDAMRTGGTLTITTGAVDLLAESAERPSELEPGPYVFLNVSDTGAGIDDETRAHMFEPFFTTKGTGEGTGLGLATAYGIVRQSGGTIAITSKVDRGTTLRVLLPRVKGADSETGVESRLSTTVRHETILVVEDEEMVRKLVQRILVSAGYDVVLCSSPGDALLYCERSGAGVELLLSDVIMPGLNGVELAKRLAPLIPNAKVLLMSGYTNDALQGTEGVAFLAKPFTAASLTEKIRSVLDGS